MIYKLQQAMNEIINWCDRWGHVINFDKTKAQYFTTKYVYPNQIEVNQMAIPYERHHKFLGMYLDSPRLSWSEHANQLISKYAKHVSIMKSVSSCHWGSDRQILIQYYITPIRSRIGYGGQI